MEAQASKAIETVQLLWIAIGILLASNFGVFLEAYIDHRTHKKEKKENEITKKDNVQAEAMNRLTAAIEKNTETMREFEDDLRRMFTAVKLIAGKKWPQISKIIQEEHPRRGH